MQNGQIKSQIESLLSSTHRPGIETVINHLHGDNDAFYTVPASTKYHDNFHGGLAKHSLDVYMEAKTMYDRLVKSAHPTNPVECCADANPKTMLPNDT